MKADQLYLFKDKRFLPIFIVQLCGCLNDSILKNSLIIFITYKLGSSYSNSSQFLVLLANIAFILPFVIFASLAGQVADKFERTIIVKIIKLVEIAIVALGVYGFLNDNLSILFVCITCMGVHSAFFGPIKYSVLPDHLKKYELLGANGYIEAGTFIAILLGTLIGGFYNSAQYVVIVIAFSITIIGFVSSFYMPKSGNSNSDLKINFNLLQETKTLLKYAHEKKNVYFAILGISWFWFIGAAILAQIPSLTKYTLGADENVANLFLATFSLGVGVGSFWCNKIFKNEITTKYVFAAAMGISLFGIDLYFASKISAISYEPEQLKNIWSFLSKKHYWRILIDLFFLAAIGGLYIVPLFAVMQHYSSPAYRSRVIAANNFINSIFMAGSTVILSILFSWGFSIPSVILMVSLFNIVVALYIYKIIPDVEIVPYHGWRMIFRFVFDKFYNVEVKGIENFHKAGKRTVIISNHISYIDPALISSYLPEKLTFAINTVVSQALWVKPFLKIVNTIPLDPTNPMSIKTLIDILKTDKKIAIFPEGRISTTGSLMKIYEGPGMIADKADATILPIRIDGPQFTFFSKLKHIFKSKLFTKVTITILPPVKITPPESLDSKQRRKYISTALYDIMVDMMFESSNYKNCIYQSLIEAVKVHGPEKQIMQDIDNNILTYRSLLLKTFTLGNVFAKNSKAGEYVGLMLPNMVVSAVCFYALQAYSRIPVMINFTSGAANIISACRTVNVKTIYTSHKFIEKANLENEVEKIILAGINIIYLEEIRSKINLITKLKGLIASHFPQTYYNFIAGDHKSEAPAVVLFTSGTEGKPKAVILSHQNLLANKHQVLAILDLAPHDIAFNALPLFHCFGLTGFLIMSLSGVKTFFYPSPLHYRIIPEVIYDIGATIMFSTDTFLNGYATYSHSYDFFSLRYIFAGAEKLKSSTRQNWFDKFGIRIFEGYGVTEAAPVVAVNTPMYNKPGSVGRLLPKTEYFIEEIEGITEGGRLWIKGPNIMLGYVRPEMPGVIEEVFSDKLGRNWYDTGDIVKIDEDGYVTILGRAKRFAKIGGEMVSLLAVEEFVGTIYKDNIHAVVNISDEKKGEMLLLFTTAQAEIEALIKQIPEQGLTMLYLPKHIIQLKEMPILPTGKIDYNKLTTVAKEYIHQL